MAMSEISQALTEGSNFSWNLEVWHSKGQDLNTPWKLLFSFSENEFFPLDYENASFVITHKPADSLFLNNVMCVRHVLLNEISDLDTEAKAQLDLELGQYPAEISKYFLYKYIMMGSEVKRSIGSSSVTVRTLTSEVERIRALREVFGLDIPDAAGVHIEGRKAALS